MDVIDSALPPAQIYILLAACLAICGVALNNIDRDPGQKLEAAFDGIVVSVLSWIGTIASLHVVWLLILRVPDDASNLATFHLYFHGGLLVIATFAFWGWARVKSDVRSRF